MQVLARFSRSAAPILILPVVSLLAPRLEAQVEVGQPLPALRLPNADGGALRSLAEFRGRPLLLHVYASW